MIAGMHRSGTSYLAKSLSLLGLRLPKSIRPGSPDNPKGHYESFDVAQYHEHLLTGMELSWDTFVLPPEEWFASKHAGQAAVDLCKKVKRDYPGKDPIVLKDPRIGLFLPVWRNIADRLDMQDFYIIPFRHPFEVAASLNKRNKISRTRAIMIWLAYLFAEEKHSRDVKRSFLCFPQWTENVELSIEKIERDLDVSFPEKNQKNLLKVRKEFEQNLVHYNEHRPPEASSEVEHLALDVFNSFLSLTIDPDDANAFLELNEQKARFENISALFAEMVIDLDFDNLTHLKQQSSQRDRDRDRDRERGRFVGRTEALQQRAAESELRVEEMEMQLKKIAYANRDLDKEINELRVRNHILAKEFEQILLDSNEQKLAVIRPLYRNIYRMTGLALRTFFPSAFVESLKKIAPNPDGVPKRLTYKPKIIREASTPFEIFVPVNATARPDILILSIINWNFRHQRPQHIAQGLAESGRRVFYIEMEQTKGDLKLTTISKNLYKVRLSGRDLGHIQPYSGQPGSTQIEQWLAAFYQLCDTVGCTSFKQIIVQHPFWWNLARHLSPEFQIIFDCMDDISGFSNTEQFLLELEADLLSKCDRLVVSSQCLHEKYEHYQTPILIRNASDLDHFVAPKKGLVKPAFLEQSLSKKGHGVIKVGYVGAIAEWFDVDLLKEVVETDPSLEFHLCGSVTTSEPAQLEDLDNIKMYGEIPYSDVPGFLNEMDVMIIPFKIIPIIQACDPVKFYEYSAMGKPTVTTALPELSRASNLIFAAETPAEFRKQIHSAYERGKIGQFREQLREYAAENTWKHRVSCLEGVLEEMPLVTIVILGYGDPELTKGAVYSLFESGPSYPNMEVLVVDNGSSPEALNGLKKYIREFPNVTLIENGENLGFAKGNNVGLEAATGEYVMLLNNDTFVAPGAVYAMVRHLARNPAIGAVGPLTNSIGNEAKLFVEYEDMDQMRLVSRSATTGYRDACTRISVVAYFAVMFRRHDMKEFGLLSEDYGRGMFEDDDHCAVIKSKGYICALAEDAFVHHHHAASFSKIDADAHNELFENNKALFENKWGKWKPHKYREGRPKPSYKSRG